MLPIIELDRFVTGNAETRRAVAAELDAACRDVGFFYLAGHGVAEDVIDGALDAMVRFFALPHDEKRRSERPAGCYRGYLPTMAFSENRAGSDKYLYEAFIVGRGTTPPAGADATLERLYAPNVWPEAPADFRAAAEAYAEAVGRVETALAAAFGLVLAGDEAALASFFRNRLTNMSMLHYPARETAGPDDARPHRDTNVFTVLLPGRVGGLQVEHRRDGWIDVEPLPGCFVVNIANMLEIWSGGRFRSTMHRVHPPVGRERYSIGYFSVPSADTVVTPLVAPLEGADLEISPLRAGDGMAEFIAQFDRPVA